MRLVLKVGVWLRHPIFNLSIDNWLNRPLPMKMMLRCLSTEEQARENQSLPAQKRKINIISEELFNDVQKRLKTKGTSHKKLNEDFPLRGVIRCATCGKLLTAGCAKGRSKHYAHYWCWTPKCKKVNIRREALEKQFVSLLSRIEPTAELMAELPSRIAEQWRERKEYIDNSTKRLNRRLADQKALNQKAVLARLSEVITADDFDTFKITNAEAIASIEAEIKALRSERETMESMLEQAAIQAVDLVGAWDKGNVNQRQELAKSFFPDGLVFSHKRGFFEPANSVINEMLVRFLMDMRNNGAPDGI
jgi:site-specific DNA recombinase